MTMKPAMVVLMLLFLLVVVPDSEAAIACSDVIKDLRPCINYLKSGSGVPPPACCTGVKTLQSAASTTADKQTACGCLKTASQKINPNVAAAQALPGNCGVSLSFTISPSVDCSKIS